MSRRISSLHLGSARLREDRRALDDQRRHRLLEVLVARAAPRSPRRAGAPPGAAAGRRPAPRRGGRQRSRRANPARPGPAPRERSCAARPARLAPDGQRSRSARPTSRRSRSTRSPTPPTPGCAHGGGVAGAIARAGGPEIQDESDELAPIGARRGGLDGRRRDAVQVGDPRRDDGARRPDLGRDHPRRDAEHARRGRRARRHGRWPWSPSAPAWAGFPIDDAARIEVEEVTPAPGDGQRARAGRVRRVRRARPSAPSRPPWPPRGAEPPGRRRSDQRGIRRTWRAKFSAWISRSASGGSGRGSPSQVPLPGPE